MTRPDTTRDMNPRRDDGAGLLVLVVAILAGTAWTVGAFLESSPTSARSAAMPVAAPVEPTGLVQEDCVDCDEHTLAPLPSWHSAAIAPDVLLRAAETNRPEGARATRRPTGAPLAPWMRVSAPAASDVEG